MTQDAVDKLFPIGLRVKRGPNWSWFNQDIDVKTGKNMKGIVYKECDGAAPNSRWWICVKWDDGSTNCYDVGDNFYSIISVDGVSGTVAVLSKTQFQNGPRNNDGSAVCFWCPNTNTQKRGGGMYDVCPKCGR